MNWRRYFTSTILERGKKYQKDGLVDDLKKVGDTYSAISTRYYEDKQFLYQVLDEAQYIKNHTTAVAKGTIEEKIVKLQESKKDLADEILSGENGGLAQLSREELLELL